MAPYQNADKKKQWNKNQKRIIDFISTQFFKRIKSETLNNQNAEDFTLKDQINSQISIILSSTSKICLYIQLKRSMQNDQNQEQGQFYPIRFSSCDNVVHVIDLRSYLVSLYSSHVESPAVKISPDSFLYNCPLCDHRQQSPVTDSQNRQEQEQQIYLDDKLFQFLNSPQNKDKFIDKDFIEVDLEYMVQYRKKIEENTGLSSNQARTRYQICQTNYQYCFPAEQSMQEESKEHYQADQYNFASAKSIQQGIEGKNQVGKEKNKSDNSNRMQSQRCSAKQMQEQGFIEHKHHLSQNS